MKNLAIFCMLLGALISPVHVVASSDTFVDYQNYNHGYCPECNSYPCRCNAGAAADDYPTYPAQDAPPYPYPYPPPNGNGVPPGYSSYSFGGTPPPAANGAVPPVNGNGPLPPPPNGKVPPPPPPKPPCQKPEPCAPKPVCATNCGVRLCWVGLAIAAVATAAAIIIGSDNGPPPPLIPVPATR